MMYEATHLRGNRYAIRPQGALGTCGWTNGEAWTVTYVTARNLVDAMLKFHCSHNGKPAIEEQV